MPKEDRFFDLFAKHAQTLVAGADALRDVLAGGPRMAEHGAAVMHHENDADAITREVLLAVRRTFITPFDRGDIKDLITYMDDAIDQMQKTVKAINLFEITTFEPQMQEMAELIVKAAHITVEAVPLLKSMNKDAHLLSVLTEQITHIEENADHLHDQGLKTLFKACGKADAMAFIAGQEIYGHLEKVLDRFEDVANKINSIVIEHV
jgi:uncharacterized protein